MICANFGLRKAHKGYSHTVTTQETALGLTTIFTGPTEKVWSRGYQDSTRLLGESWTKKK